MSTEPSTEKCDSCEINPASEPHTCPYKQAAGSAKDWPIEQQDELCNCCDECTHDCWMRS